MKKFGQFVVKNKLIILIVFVLALIPAVIGMINTKINYNILVYLPKDIETMKGQDILQDDFGIGSFSISIIDNMNADDVLTLENQIKNIDGVNSVCSLYDVIGTTIPIEMLPEDVQERVAKGDSTLLLIIFNDSISDENTMKAVEQIRSITNEDVKVGGMTAMVLDTKTLSDSEVAIYVVIAVICCIAVLMIALDSYTIPFILLLNIGCAILYNMGTNIFLGDISYITKAISAILQLGVTSDFSIFLYNQYQRDRKKYATKEEAMAEAINETLGSILGSSATAMAGFLALCTMQLTLGTDIGIVMAKGIFMGVICVITLFPALILFLDKIITKTSHKQILPEFKHVNKFVEKRYKWIFVIFLLLIIPAWYGNKNVKVYYNLDKTLPSTLASSVANTTLEDDYNIVSPMIVLVNKDLSNEKINQMIDDIKKIDHIDFAVSYAQLSNLNIPDDMINEDTLSYLKSNNYQLIIINSTYEKATEELNNQIDEINSVVKSYDSNSIVAGEGALLSDLVNIADEDFQNVNYTSLAVILVIIIIVFGSLSLPVLLVAAIEFAIFVNMAWAYYGGVELPFVASIVIGTIQLGATIDYAILMTNKYLSKRKEGNDKFVSVRYALDNSAVSIFTSGLCFFAATFGVGLYSKLEMVGSLCTLISRGAIISMIVVITVLPSLLLMFDKIIIKTTKGFKKGVKKNMKNNLKVAVLALACIILPLNTNALSKEETVYAISDNTGTISKTIVSEHLINSDNDSSISDISNLTDISNTNGDETYSSDGSSLTWYSQGNDIYYRGLTTESLPVTLNINYYLDGEKISDLSSIEGKEGHIKISVDFTNTQKHYMHSNTLYTPFTVLLTTSLKNTSNSNVEVSDGTVLDNGTSSYIAAIAMPGLYESLNLDELKNLDNITIEFDTTDFETSTMYAVITPKFISTDDIDSKLNTLYSSMTTLSTSSDQLVSGSQSLYEGLSELNESYATFNSKLQELNSGLKTLNSSYSQINSGIATITNGISSLNDAVNGTNGLSNSVAYLASQTQNLATSASSLTSLVTNLNTMINSLKSIADTTTDATTAAQINGLLSQFDANSLTELSDLQTAITNLNTAIQSINTAIQSQLKPSVTALVYGSSSLNSGSTTFKSGLGYAYSGLNQLSSASNTIYSGTEDLSNGSKTLYDGMVSFDSDGIKTLVNTVNNTLKSKVQILKDLNTLSKKYTTFSGSKQTDSSTKFIIKINK